MQSQQSKLINRVFEVTGQHQHNQETNHLVSNIKSALLQKQYGQVTIWSRLAHMKRTLQIGWLFYKLNIGSAMVLRLLKIQDGSKSHHIVEIILTFNPTEKMRDQAGYHPSLRQRNHQQSTDEQYQRVPYVQVRPRTNQLMKQTKRRPKIYRTYAFDELEQQPEIPPPTLKIQNNSYQPNYCQPHHHYKLEHLNRFTSSERQA